MANGRYCLFDLCQSAVSNKFRKRRFSGRLLETPPGSNALRYSRKTHRDNGLDAVALLEKVFTRRISDLKVWRARYAIACTPQGGIIMDGVLIRLATDHFWYVEANGEFENWLLAMSDGMDVTISDPKSRVLQIQGPRSLDFLEAAVPGQVPEKFGYFHAAMFNFNGQEVLISRSGWTGELGIEIYGNANLDHSALWDYLIECGKPFGLAYSSSASMGIRRIEAGILDYGSEIDRTMTPFDAGLADFVDLSKDEFVGKAALTKANKACRLFGLTCETCTPHRGLGVFYQQEQVAIVKIGCWSPTLDKGICYVLFSQGSDDQRDWLGRNLTLLDTDGQHHDCLVVSLPFFDSEKNIPRGLPFNSTL